MITKILNLIRIKISFIKSRVSDFRFLLLFQVRDFFDKTNINLYSDELYNESMLMLKRFFPKEEIPHYLAERFQALVARSYRIHEVERKFVKSSFQHYPKRIPEYQRDFFDNYVSFLQCYYSFLSATMLFIKKSSSISKNHISTGKSTKKFLESCKGKISEEDFNILYQSTIVRSLISDHIQDGKLTWDTANFHLLLMGTNADEETRSDSKNAGGEFKYVLILYPMFEDSYNGEIRKQLDALYFTNFPRFAYISPHHEHVINSVKLLLKAFS